MECPGGKGLDRLLISVWSSQVIFKNSDPPFVPYNVCSYLCEKEKSQTTEGWVGSVRSAKRIHKDPELNPRTNIKKRGSVTHTCHSGASQAQTDKQISGIHWPEGLAYLASSRLVSKMDGTGEMMPEVDP